MEVDRLVEKQGYFITKRFVKLKKSFLQVILQKVKSEKLEAIREKL